MKKRSYILVGGSVIATVVVASVVRHITRGTIGVHTTKLGWFEVYLVTLQQAAQRTCWMLREA